MTRLLVTARPSVFDVVQLEPTLEALYYAQPECELTLRTLEGYVPFFEHHPLVSRVMGWDEPFEADDFDVTIDIPDMGDWSIRLPTVDKFAASVGIDLLRKTPKIFLETYPVDTNDIVFCQVSHRLDEWPVFTETMNSDYNTVEVTTAKDNDDLRRILQVLAGATLVVGPDSWATHAAAALDARVIMAMDLKDEALRAPFNVIVSEGNKHDILMSLKETLFEKRYPDFLNCGNAAEFIKCKAKRYLKARFVDVGCSAWPIPNGIPVDTGNRTLIEDAPDNMYAGVFSSHCLEHIENWNTELVLWHRVIRPGGVMFLYLPHPRAEVWHAHTGSWVKDNHVWNPEPVELVIFLKEVLGMHIIEYTSRRDPLWSFHIVARKV
jgi:hypothetical protein